MHNFDISGIITFNPELDFGCKFALLRSDSVFDDLELHLASSLDYTIPSISETCQGVPIEYVGV